MKCPVCETNTTTHWFRGFIVGVCLAMLIGFVCGQLFHTLVYDGSFKRVIWHLQEDKEELKKGYVPPRAR